MPGRVQKSSGSGPAFEQSSGSGLIGFLFFRKLRVRVYSGFLKKSNVRVRVQDFGFIGFLGFQYAVFIAFLCDNFFRNSHFQMIFFQKFFQFSIKVGFSACQRKFGRNGCIIDPS